MPGRSDNEIKNHWHTHLQKRIIQAKQEPKIIPSPETYHQYGLSDQSDQSSETFQKAKIAEDQSAVYDSSDVSSSCLSLNSPELSCSTVWNVPEEGMMNSSQSFEETFDCFWDDLLFADASYSSSESEGGFMSPNTSMVEEEFTLPYSLFGEDDLDFLNNFMQ